MPKTECKGAGIAINVKNCKYKYAPIQILSVSELFFDSCTETGNWHPSLCEN